MTSLTTYPWERRWSKSKSPVRRSQALHVGRHPLHHLPGRLLLLPDLLLLLSDLLLLLLKEHLLLTNLLPELVDNQTRNSWAGLHSRRTRRPPTADLA